MDLQTLVDLKFSVDCQTKEQRQSIRLPNYFDK